MYVSQFESDSTSRRSFLRDGSLLLIGAAAGGLPAFGANEERGKVRLGLLTDLHYADKPPAGTRYYRETLAKLEDAAAQFERDKPDLVVELGDFIDSADSVDIEKKYLARIHKAFAALPGDKHYVLGNHCVTTLTKEQFLGGVGQKAAHYSFDVGGFHFVVLDACFRADRVPYGGVEFDWKDANLPQEQVEWLKEDLNGTAHQTIVLAHQRLDDKGAYSVKNAAQVRQVLEASGKVLAVFQGHSHKNDLQDIRGIHYCTLAAMIEGTGLENSGFARVDLLAGGAIRLTGFRRQTDYHWQR